MEKYSKDGPFSEPVVRCDSCVKLVIVNDLKTSGCCPYCGNTRVRNVRTISDLEIEAMKTLNIDPDWIALFEPKEGADG
jgi:uncharacterized CHY-type Zn-finger protein